MIEQAKLFIVFLFLVVDEIVLFILIGRLFDRARWRGEMKASPGEKNLRRWFIAVLIASGAYCMIGDPIGVGAFWNLTTGFVVLILGDSFWASGKRNKPIVQRRYGGNDDEWSTNNYSNVDDGSADPMVEALIEAACERSVSETSDQS